MAPRKREQKQAHLPEQREDKPDQKRSKIDKEKLICRRRIAALERNESLSIDDRFTAGEKQRLLEAYNERGFQVFQDMEILHEYFPNRRQIDLKGLVDRLSKGLQGDEGDSKKDDHLEGWQKLCQGLMANYAKDKKVNLEDAISDALMIVADELEASSQPKTSIATDGEPVSNTTDSSANQDIPNYPELMRSFAQILSGKFPDNMTPSNAKVSLKLYNHVNSLVNSLDTSALKPLADGSWLKGATDELRKSQERALEGLKCLDKMAKRDITLRDIEKNKDMEILCLGLPKIRRITEVLNPLRLSESLMSSLMNL